MPAFTSKTHDLFALNVSLDPSASISIFTSSFCCNVDEFSDCDALKRRLKDAVMFKMKDEIIASRAFLHNNFYLDSDGWHFVYNAGEIDSLSTGVIDVVIARTFLKEKINGE